MKEKEAELTRDRRTAKAANPLETNVPLPAGGGDPGAVGARTEGPLTGSEATATVTGEQGDDPREGEVPGAVAEAMTPADAAGVA